MCVCCIGDEAVYYKDENNCAFVDNSGEMMVVVNGNAMTFQVDNCPACGKEFIKESYIGLTSGNRIYYVNDEDGVIEQGRVHLVEFRDDKVYSISVYFDNNDFDEFYGEALGCCLFVNKTRAEKELAKH